MLKRVAYYIISIIAVLTFVDVSAQDEPVPKNTVFFTIGGGLASSYNDYSPHENARTVGADVISSINIATSARYTLGIEFDGYIGYNLNVIAPITLYPDKRHYFKAGPSLCRVSHDFKGHMNGYGFAAGGGVVLDAGFIEDAAFKSFIVNVNYIFQRVDNRSTSHFSVTLSIRFSKEN